MAISSTNHLAIAVCGMPGSGKSLVSENARKRSIPVLSMGDLVRHELKLRDLDETPTNVGEVALNLRATFGEGILASRLLDDLGNAMKHHSTVFIEGMRSPAELQIFRQTLGSQFIVIGIRSDEEIRWKRISTRKRGEDGTREDFAARDARETIFELPKLIDEAHILLENNGDLTDFQISVDAAFDKLMVW